MSLDASAFRGPRAKRLKKLYASGVMDMQEEKFTLFSLPSTTPVDFYHRLLRSQNGQPATLRQYGVPAEDESRSVEVATDDLIQVDQSVQFCYGDDTELLAIMEAVKKRKEASLRGIRLTADESEGATAAFRAGVKVGVGVGVGTGTYDDTSDSMGTGATRLTPFLQRSSMVCERLIDEERSARSGDGGVSKYSDKPSRQDSLFKEGSVWTELATGTNGANELIRNRAVNCIQFSVLQPNLLCTAHPFVASDEDDLLPFKGIYCVWDINHPTEPTYVLAASGQPTACSFSASQTFLIIAGTSEGTLHMWDMREATAIHKDRDAVDLGIERGIRKPCYSSPLSTQGLSVIDTAGSDGIAVGGARAVGILEEQHSAPISQIVCIADADPAPAAASQFASLDQRSLICLWVSSQRDYGGNTPGLSPWGSIALILTRVLHANSHAYPHPTIDSNSGLNGSDGTRNGRNSRKGSGLWDFDFGEAVGNVGKLSVLAAVPGDVSTLLVAGARGSVNKVVRFGDAPQPHHLERSAGPCLEIAFQGRAGHSSATSTAAGVDVNLYSDVTCISVQRRVQAVPTSTEKRGDSDTSSNNSSPAVPVDEAQLVLVGKADGSVDLFRTDVSTPLQTWSFDGIAGTYSSNKKSSSSNQRPPIASVRWLPNRMTSFQIVDAEGTSYIYDLLQDSNRSLCVDALPGGGGGRSGKDKGKTNELVFVSDISRCRTGTNVSYMAIGNPAPAGRVRVRPVWEGWLRSKPSDGTNLMEALPTWALRTAAEKGRLHLVDPLAGENKVNQQHK